MGDNNDDLDLGDGESSSPDSSPRKGGGLGSLLPNLLKYAAIGLGAIIFIATVSFITQKITKKDGDSQTVVPITESYKTEREIYLYKDVGQIRTSTNDEAPRSVLVKVLLGYDKDDKTAQNEMTERDAELKDFIRTFFSLKTAKELAPENLEEIKLELKSRINDGVLMNTKVREVLFHQFDVVSM